MLVFFLIQLSLTAYARYSIYEQAIKDPVSFAQIFSKVNPDQVREVIGIVNGLIEDGQTKKQNIISDHQTAVEVLSEREKSLEKARDVYETARGERLLADAQVARMKNLLDIRQNEEAAASDEKDFATSELKSAQDWMDTEVSRVNSEKDTLEEVIEILKTLPKSFVEGEVELPTLSSHLAPIVPSLIEAVKANPEAVAQVIKLVEDLITAGEKVRAEVIAARDNKQDILNQKTELWKKAVQNTIAAKDALTNAEGVAADRLSLELELKEKWEKATAARDAATIEEASQRLRKEREVPIIDSEDISLQKVISILQGML